jgi:hemoglobin
MTTVGPFSENVSLPNGAKLDRISEAAIARLVDGFYAKVRTDAQLAPIFANAIPDDHWEPHLAKMRDFWSSVMLITGRYKGNPVAVHMAVSGMEPHLFVRWLELFGEACGELFEPEIAEAFRAKAARIAESLKLALYYRPTRNAVIPGEREHSLARGKGTHD